MVNRADDFYEQEGQGGLGGLAPTHIWLRYATQFTAGERSYTIDIGIPVPLGADAEMREQLLREADDGLDQLANYVERRVMQVAQQGGARLPTVPRPVAPAVPTPSSRPASTSTQAQPSASPAAAPAPPAPASPASRTQAPAASATPAREAPAHAPISPSPAMPMSVQQAPEAEQNNQPPTPVAPSRPGIGASMPSSPGLPGGTLSLPEFLKYLKDMGLDARRAMALLKVKSLSDLNLREALKQLQHILMEEGANPSTPTPAPANRQQAQAQTPARPPTGPQAPTRNQSSAPRAASGPAEGHSAGKNPGPARANESNPVAGKATTRIPQGTQSTQSPQSAQSMQKTQARAAGQATPSAPHAAPAPASDRAPRPATPPSSVTSAARPAAGPGSMAQPAVGAGARNVREGQASYPAPIVFDEEDDESELEDLDFDEDEDEEEETVSGASIGLSAAHRGNVEDIVSRLRESGGTALVSATRLKVLHNVVDGQLRPEQLQALIRGVWGAASEKKLKSDQAEALISWGKQDDFVTEAEMLLAHFEEE